MIRVYLDSDVINSIKDGRDTDLSEFIESNRDKLITPISPAHISDKLPSKTHPKFKGDLDFLTSFSEKHIMIFDGEKGYTSPNVATTWDILEWVESTDKGFTDIDVEELFSIPDSESQLVQQSDELQESTRKLEALMNQKVTDFDGKEVTAKESIVGLITKMQDYILKPEKYKESRDEIWAEYKLPENAGTWKENVITKINKELEANGKKDFLSMSYPPEKGSKLDNVFSSFTTAYLNFNLIGYRPDKIKRNKGFRNHFNDATHAFYGAHCHYFIVKDKEMYPKAKALYDEYNISTKVFTVDEFLDSVKKVLIENSSEIHAFVKDVKDDEPIDVLVEDGQLKSLYRLGSRAFDYFSHMQVELSIDNDSEKATIMFLNQLSTYSSFMFYKEHDSIFKKVHELFTGGKNLDVELEKFKSFYLKKESAVIDYLLPNTAVRLHCTGSKFTLSLVIDTAVK